MGGFSTPAAAVSNFLTLTDTPAAYAGQGMKGARVNTAEDAIEFGPSWEGPVNPSYDSNIIFGPAVGPGAYTDLDVGVGPCIAFLKIDQAASGAWDFYFRQKGATLIPAQGMSQASTPVNRQLLYVMVLTDSAGLVEWRTTDPNNLTITRLAYWPDPPMPNAVIASGANTPNVDTTLNVGVANALVVLAFTTTEVADYRVGCKMFTETADLGFFANDYYGITSGFAVNTNIIYALALTDSEGRVSWRASVAGRNYTITLLAYIRGIETPGLLLYTGLAPQTVTVDFDTPFGRGFIYTRHLQTVNAAGGVVSFRGNGEAEMVGVGAGVTSVTTILNKANYGFLPLDEYGVCEWRYQQIIAAEYEISAEAVSR